MATLLNITNGNFTSATTWGLVDATSLSDSENTTSNSTTSFVSSATFTPGVIMIDAIALKVFARSATLGGTVSVRLAIAGVAVANTTVTINVNDLYVSHSGWAVFKLAAPVALVSATAYTVQVSSSINSSVTFWRSATASDWSRMLRTTATQAPATGDNLNICGEYTGAGTFNTLTVTMNNTAATIFGKIEVSGHGTLIGATAASTAYKLTTGSAIGNFYVNGDGIVTFGTSGTPMPSSSSMTLQLNQNAVAVTNGITLRGSGSFTTYGATKTIKAFLNADAAVSATSLTSDISTSWSSGDVIAVASTTRTAGETETVTMSSNASGTTLPISALSFAHSGTSPTKAEIGNLTRNIKITGESITLPTYINLNTDTVFSVSYTELNFMGSTTSGKRGIDVGTTIGSVLVDNCAFKNWENGASFGLLINQAANANITCTNTIFYRCLNSAFLTATSCTASTIVFNNILAFTSPMASVNGQAMTFTNITAVGSGITFGQIAVLTGLSIDNITAHSCSAAGISFTTLNQDLLTATNLTSWRNTTRGLFFSSAKNIYINNITVFGNATAGLDFTQTSQIEFNNVTANGGITLTQPIAFNINSSVGLLVTNSSLGVTTSHSTGDVSFPAGAAFVELNFRNCILGSSTEVANQTNISTNSIIGSSKHDQTAGTHRFWRKYGIITADTVINYTPSVSLRATPNNATYKLTTMPRKFAIPSGKTARVSVAIRRSAAGDGTAYNGNLPRLILRSNNSAGVTTDTVLATATAASLGAWETIAGTTPSVTDNTVYSVYVDCDGTTGWINEDNWKIQIINGAALGTNINSEDYYQDGRPVVGINTLLSVNSNSETYWIDGQPSPTLFPVSAVDTGKYWLLFE